ncbi:MAG: ATP-binding protein, partial [Pseudomonadota bacterium]|nr:ATP-binding protein [Pseudomonadota bacterium]
NKQAPQIVLLQGVSGSGKSYFSKQLVQQLDAVVISSDIERKRLFGIKPTYRVSENDKKELYSDEMSRKTYQRLQDLAKQISQFGLSVIVDATFLKQVHRQAFYNLAEQLACGCKLIYIDSDSQTAEQAIEQRLHLNNDPSDADAQVMQRQREVLETPTEDEVALTLKASELRKFFPDDLIQEFLF